VCILDRVGVEGWSAHRRQGRWFVGHVGSVPHPLCHRGGSSRGRASGTDKPFYGVVQLVYDGLAPRGEPYSGAHLWGWRSVLLQHASCLLQGLGPCLQGLGGRWGFRRARAASHWGYRG